VLFVIKRNEWGVEVYPSLRTQTQARRFRIPDVLVMRREDQFERYVTTPPLIAVEILSPEDTPRAMQEKAAEYRQFGIEYIWIIDPEPRIAYRYTGSSLEEEHSGELTVPGTPIRVALSEMFAELDRV
jgi:Uma2 family endonuclease